MDAAELEYRNRLALEVENDALKAEIAERFWRCNQLTQVQAAEYACLAVDIMRKERL